MKPLFLIPLFFAIPVQKQAIEPMFYEERMIGVKVYDGVTHYEENGKTVYYIPAKTLEKLPR